MATEEQVHTADSIDCPEPSSNLDQNAEQTEDSGEYNDVEEEFDEFYDDGYLRNDTYVKYNVMGVSTLSSVDDKTTDSSVRYGVIDSGASATVCGIRWLSRWYGGRKIQEQDLNEPGKHFRFGDGHAKKSLGQATLSVRVIDTAGKEICFSTKYGLGRWFGASTDIIWKY